MLVAAWLAALATTHGSSALGSRVAAIAYHHRRRGVPFVATHPAIRETLSGIRRAHPRLVRPAAALTSTGVKQLLNRRHPIALPFKLALVFQPEDGHFEPVTFWLWLSS